MTKILLIEDEEAIRENILDLLDAEDFETFAAPNGNIGISLATEKLPDLIICDVMMPEVDGHDVLKTLRSNPRTATIPFIFLTARADKVDLRQGMELGADDYLTKPCTPDELMRAIAIRLEKKALLHQETQQKLDELRSSISYSIPHELRTPLNGILGFTELILLAGEDMEKSEILEMVEHINTSGKRLYRLIVNFLLYAELELARTKPERIAQLQNQKTFSVKDLIAEKLLQQAQEAAREADLQLNLTDAQLAISGNYLQKLVEELVDNAWKFSPPGKAVLVSSKVENDSFILEVKDKGRGMKPEEIDKIGSYMQFDRKLYEQQGTGLGLAIAQRLADLHRGKLILESIPQQGTTVRVMLPLA
ncbi:MAG: response regulator [Oscillatoria sp. PMC 1051.18]|nr:response regulator [Oscillatoria sp. PMC 1050.18]MEC5029265.1 response regulator [Oscillatoria sp. PMC 1051.18]